MCPKCGKKFVPNSDYNLAERFFGDVCVDCRGKQLFDLALGMALFDILWETIGGEQNGGKEIKGTSRKFKK